MLYRLHEAGFNAYLVGGCVRDLLLGYQPKDFDIATNARPEEIRKLFKNCRLIGKRFRLAHILFGSEVIEVATFRTHHQNAEEEQHARMRQGMIIRDNVFGPIEDDAVRRDFSINALYYNIADFSVVDYIGGMEDIKTQRLRMIGDPELRFREDPIRLLRAARFMGKLKLTISPETESPMTDLSFLLEHVSPSRLFSEVLKFFADGALLNTFHLLQRYKLFPKLFPQTASSLERPEVLKFIEMALANTDLRLQQKKTVSPAFLLAVFLWNPIKNLAHQEEVNGYPIYVAYEKSIHLVLKKQTERLSLTRVLQVAIQDICFLQHRFTQRFGARPYRALEHPRFRAAFDLLLLRADSGEDVRELADWWTTFQTQDPSSREKMIKEKSKTFSGKKRRRPKKFKKEKTS